MADHGFETLGATLKRLGVVLTDDPIPDSPEQLPGCSKCRDAGWLSRDGRAVECPCGLVAQRRTSMIWASSQVPESMRGYSLGSFVERSGKPELADAVRAAWDGGERWLLLTGPVGVGKTGIAVSLLNEHLASGAGGLYVVTPTMLSRIRSTYGGDADDAATEATVMSSLIQTPLLLLDDLGKVRLTDWGQEKLFTILNERYIEHRRTIVTSNLGASDGELERHVWPATFDRLIGLSDVFEIDGRSLR